MSVAGDEGGSGVERGLGINRGIGFSCFPQRKTERAI